MEEQVISFGVAKLAKEKDFPQEGFKVWVTDLDGSKRIWNSSNSATIKAAPTQSLLQKHLREKHKVRVFVDQSTQGIFRWVIYKWNHDNNLGKWQRIAQPLSYNTYEEALEAGLKAALELI